MNGGMECCLSTKIGEDSRVFRKSSPVGPERFVVSLSNHMHTFRPSAEGSGRTEGILIGVVTERP